MNLRQALARAKAPANLLGSPLGHAVNQHIGARIN